MPDLADPTLASQDFSVSALQAGAVVGLYQGSRLMSTVGGFMSVDAFATASWLLLPADAGFDDSPAALTLGARLGILREGFTVPGVAVSVSRSFVSATTLSGAGTLEAAVDPSVTSLRATIGKDAGGFELLAGWGLDDRSADIEVGGAAATIQMGTLEHRRQQWFGSVARTFRIVLTLGLEVGRASGGEPATGLPSPFDAGAGLWFGALSARLTF